MLISIIGSNNNKREIAWLNFWRDEFERIGCEVVLNAEPKKLDKADALVLLDDGRPLPKSAYFQLGYFYHLKSHEERHLARLLVAFDEVGDLNAKLVPYFDHITKTEKGLINTVKDYLYFTNKNARAKS